MSFIYYCIHCSQKIDVDDTLENKAAVCPTCNKSIFLIKTVQSDNAAAVETCSLPQRQPPVQPPPVSPVSPSQTSPVKLKLPQTGREVPVGKRKEYKILQESLRDYFSMYGSVNLEKGLNDLAAQGWRVISSMPVGDPLAGALVFVLERDK